MHLSGTARRVIAVAIALQAGFATTLLGAGGAAARQTGCEGVTGHLVDHGTTVTAVFHVPTTCREVSVLSWLAPDAHAGLPQTLYDRKGEHDVAPGDYRWTIAAPPPECFRQLDLRIPGHNVDAIVGGGRLCSLPPPTTTTPPTTTPTTSKPTTTRPPAPEPAPDAVCTHWNVIAKSHEVTDGRYVQHFTLDAKCAVLVVSFTASGPNWPGNGPQTPFDRWQGTRGPGSHTVSVALPPCFFQADLVVNHRVLDTATGGTRPCAAPPPPAPRPAVTTTTSTPPAPTTTTEATTTTTAPPPSTTSPTVAPRAAAPGAVASSGFPAPILPTAVAPLRIAPTAPSPSTTTPVAVLGVVLTPPAAAAVPLPKTGGQQSGMAGVALMGIGLGFALVTVGRRRRRSLPR